ncbi:unnamed protein product [Candidula unifasciata]|uniref:F-box domain-containing protein n=1 Tax=Candidula unifasciata TaxID=100452 RepID=A0A8S3ZLC4_9EUPU|nr:unnamed protein product [Candidula unifasciata]
MLNCFKKMHLLVKRKQKKDLSANNYGQTSPFFLEPMSEVALSELILSDLKKVQIKQTEVAEKQRETSRFGIENLPDVVLGKIISYLHWKEKEWLLLAIPSLERLMNSPLAWENFENDRSYATEKLYMYICFPFLMEHELSVIKKYGRFFQTCTLWIHKVTTFDKERGNDFRLLGAVSKHCHGLKALSIMHTSDISVPMLKTCAQSYIWSLQELVLKRGSGFRLSLKSLFYASIESVETGIFSYLTYIQEKGLLCHLSCLDFSHGLIIDFGSNKIAPFLVQCVNLRILKCPIQTVNSNLIICLVKKNLSELYVVNDDHTQQTCFSEKIMMDWNKVNCELSMVMKYKFNVHYIFKNRTVCNEDMIPNPFLKSLIFDNLSSNISASLLHHIANLYGQTILNLAFCSNYWEFLMHFADLGRINESFKYLGRKCLYLKSFLSCLSLPSSALFCLVVHSRHLSTVRVYKENVRLSVSDKPEGFFLQKMAEALGTPSWDMVKKGDNIFIVPSVNCKLLFASCFSEF